MADIADNGNETADQFLTLAIEANQLKRRKVTANGHCLNCDEPLAADMRWCNSDCRDDWQALNPNT